MEKNSSLRIGCSSGVSIPLNYTLQNMTARKIYNFIEKRWLFLALIGFFFLSLSLFFVIESRSTHAKIPAKERESLENFLHRVIGQDHFGFALFGSKAIALTGYFPIVPSGNVHCFSCSEMQRDEFRAWRKYKKLLSSENFIWTKTRLSPLIIEIALINKKKCIQVISEHLELFQTRLQQRITPEKLLENLISSKKHTLEFLKNDDLLLGILLGYGEKSSSLYQRREYLAKALRPEAPFMTKNIDPSSNFFSAEEEYNYLNENMCTWQNERARRWIYRFSSVKFMNLGEPEAFALIEKYEKDNEKIASFFLNRSFLEATLSQVHSANPIYLDP